MAFSRISTASRSRTAGRSFLESASPAIGRSGSKITAAATTAPASALPASQAVQSGALIAARGNGDHSAGGTVNIWADNDAVARQGALVDASAGELAAADLVVALVDHDTFDPALVKTVRGAAERLGYSHMDIISGAGHDACWINRVAPTVMVMCPCVDGLSHNEAEEISPEWAAAGADVLFHAVLETAVVTG